MSIMIQAAIFWHASGQFKTKRSSQINEKSNEITSRNSSNDGGLNTNLLGVTDFLFHLDFLYDKSM